MRLETLKKNRDFGLVYKKGKSCASRLIVLVYLKKRAGGARAGFSVSKKVGKSVVRNKKRRQLKECFLCYVGEISESADIIFIARAPIAEAEFSEILKDMRYLLKKARLI